ncbi:MAG: 6,7-dimethyl-8-ribityllumazine synthase [Candidatus Omnitrophica bacterium]|nr:6,7-dimethyl-8-ribityllumazine synthase [Candidatus Omnitrophota bacterium]
MKKRVKKSKYAIVVARFNEVITQRLLDACLDELAKNGVANNDIMVTWVPGAFEIPVVALKLARKKSVDAVICLGAVIRGETYHYELVAQGAAQGILQASLTTGKPVIFEVLAAETMGNVSARAQKKGTNKGRDAALAAIEMVDVLKKI